MRPCKSTLEGAFEYLRSLSLSCIHSFVVGVYSNVHHNVSLSVIYPALPLSSSIMSHSPLSLSYLLIPRIQCTLFVSSVHPSLNTLLPTTITDQPHESSIYNHHHHHMAKTLDRTAICEAREAENVEL